MKYEFKIIYGSIYVIQKKVFIAFTVFTLKLVMRSGKEKKKKNDVQIFL